MAWSIANLVNDVEISNECAKDIFAAQEYENEYFWDEDDVAYNGKLMFNSDHMEHMDYVSDSSIQAVLCKHKVSGDICFGDLEGDNFGSFWGYRFDGEGGMTEIEGILEWKVKED